MTQQEWNSENMADLVKIIKEICHDVLKEEGVPCFISAVVQAVHLDGTVDVYLPPDTTAILRNKINKTGVILNPGDSVELCCKKGRLGDAWVAVKHGIDAPVTVSGSGTGTVTTNDYNSLTNLPTINGVQIIGNKATQDFGIEDDKTYVHTQTTPVSEWIIIHNLNKYPSIIIVNDELIVKLGDIQYLDLNRVKISFDQPFTGQAFLN